VQRRKTPDAEERVVVAAVKEERKGRERERKAASPERKEEIISVWRSLLVWREVICCQ
jgi:hypothetical protein